VCLLRLSLSGCKVTCKTTGIGTLVGFKHGQTKVQPRQELITCGEIIRIEVVLKGPSPYPCCHSLRRAKLKWQLNIPLKRKNAYLVPEIIQFMNT